jgi:hypothetical protein
MSRFHNPDIHTALNGHNDYRYVYKYDEVNRLLDATYWYGASVNDPTDQFKVGNLTYDANGNILSLRRFDENEIPVDRLRYDYGSNNQLEAVYDSSTTHHGWDAFSSEFGYDENGNIISQSGKFTNIAYEHRNLPIHFYLENDEELIANYNAEGQRILKEFTGGGWSSYVTDGMQTMAVITEQGFLI